MTSLGYQMIVSNAFLETLITLFGKWYIYGHSIQYYFPVDFSISQPRFD